MKWDPRYYATGIVFRVEYVEDPGHESGIRASVTVRTANGQTFTGPWGLADTPEIGSKVAIATCVPVED